MPTIEEIIGDIIKIEGPPTNDPTDRGGRTAFGISETSNPQAWADGKVTEAEAREIYEAKYVKWPKFDQVTDTHLMAQLVDWSVTSGPYIAIINLQKILNVDPDGAIGPVTLAALAKSDPKVVNNQLMLERIKMIGRIISKNPTQVRFINGWLLRCCGFLV